MNKVYAMSARTIPTVVVMMSIAIGAGAVDAQEREREEVGVLVENWERTNKGDAPLMALGQCPGESPWHGELLSRLADLPLSERRIEALALIWGSAQQICHQEALLPWFERALARVETPQTARILGVSLRRMDLPEAADVLRSAALNETHSVEVRGQLQISTFSLYPRDARDERIAFFAEALRAGVLTEYAVRKTVPFLINGERRDEFALRAIEAATAHPQQPAAEYVLMAVFYAANIISDDSAPAGFSLRTRAEVVRLLRDSGAYDRMEPQFRDRIQGLVDAVRVRGG